MNCKQCQYYYGQHNLVCAVHPNGKENCPDHDPKKLLVSIGRERSIAYHFSIISSEGGAVYIPTWGYIQVAIAFGWKQELCTSCIENCDLLYLNESCCQECGKLIDDTIRKAYAFLKSLKDKDIWIADPGLFSEPKLIK